MAIKANMTTHDGIALTQAYCIVRNAKVAKLEDDSFELQYEVQIYAAAAQRAEETEQDNRILNTNLKTFKCVYDPDNGEQNAFKLAYVNLKTQSGLASIVDA